MKTLFTYSKWLPLVIKKDWRQIDLPICLVVGGKHFTYRIEIEIKNYMLVLVAVLLSLLILVSMWQPSHSMYIKNMWVQMGTSTSLVPNWMEKMLIQNHAQETSFAHASAELISLTSSSAPDSQADEKLPIFVHDIAEYEDLASLAESENELDEFMIQKQIHISKALIKNKVSRLDQLDDKTLLELNKKISQLFIQLVLKNLNAPPHVWNYFTDSVQLRKIETALMEQVKYNVPASIKLAQSALETAYGSRIVHNNYFGIKSKDKQGGSTITTEYFTAEEAAMNQDIILTQKPVIKNGQVLYECKVQDYFSEYESAWQSFRAHSEFLVNNRRYAPLFAKGKKYEEWADKIGSERTGGVGYATSPLYGELLKKIIRRYQLHLLDH